MNRMMGWTPNEWAAILQLCEEKDLDDRAVIRQALRLYQMVHVRAKRGEHMIFVNQLGKRVDEPVGCPALD